MLNHSTVSKKTVLFALVALFCGGLLLLLICELALRAIFGSPYLNSPEGLYVADDQFDFLMKANYRGVWRNPEFRMRIETNSFGFRDDEWGVRSANFPSAVRVLALGDSFVFGTGVQHEENMVTIAENIPQEGAFDILNAGVSAWGPLQYVGLMERLLSEHRVDCVAIFFFVGNDFVDIVQPRGRWRPYRGLLLSARNFDQSQSLLSLKIFVWKHVKTLPVLRKAVRQLIDGDRPNLSFEWPHVATALIKPEPYIDETGGAAKVRQALQRLRELGDTHGVKVALVLIPSRFQVSATHRDWVLKKLDAQPDDFSVDYPTGRLKEFAEEFSLPLLDYSSLMKEEGVDPDMFYYENDGHWNAQGHAWAAKPLANFLNQLTPNPSARAVEKVNSE